MENNGWIKLHRGLLDWEWYDDHNVTRLFLHCIIRANHAPKKWRGVQIERGQFYTSLETLSLETGLSQRQIRTCLDKLKTTGEVASLGMARGRMVTVKNYHDYQLDDRLDVSRASGSRQADDRLMTANKNDKNNKKDKNLSNGVPPKGDEDLPFDSDKFKATWLGWIAYRKEIRKAMKPTTIKAQLKKLSIYSEADALTIIQTSIEKGWIGLVADNFKTIKENETGLKPIKGGVFKIGGRTGYITTIEEINSAKKTN